jgi:predicted RNA-binding Zn ribbon-like protein
VVNLLEDSQRWRAPVELELVRRFLNTWDFSARTRTAEDHLPAVAADRAAWKARFAGLAPPKRRELAQLTELRDGLRRLVEEGFESEPLNVWLRRMPPLTRVEIVGDDAPRLEHVPSPTAGTAGQLVAIVVDAIETGTWSRLKACRDCRLIFYDTTRNRSKRWCQMSAARGGRACGSIAKVRRWRARQGRAQA